MKTIFNTSLLIIGLGLSCRLAMAHETGNTAPAYQEDRPMLALKSLPADPEAYQPEVAELCRNGVPARYGQAEWAAIVLTHEMHQHVGIYTVLGAKMGVRAREVLKAPMRAVRVSLEVADDKVQRCAADGLQVALGSTYAQGLIVTSAKEGAPFRCAFTYGGQVLVLTIKPEVQASLDAIIRDAREKNGFLTPAYFEDIEHACFKVWEEFDRTVMFEERIEKAETPMDKDK